MRSGILVALAVTLSLSMILVPTGCGGGAEGTISEVELGGTLLRDYFALYYPVAASTQPGVPAYTVSMDLSNVEGAGAVTLPQGAARALAAQGFVALAGEGDSMDGIYADAQLPPFVSVDALLHVFSRLCAFTLGDIEERYLAADLGELVRSLHETMLRMYGGCEGTVREAALANVAFLCVAARLLGVDVPVPAEVEAAVKEELSLVEAHSGVAPSPVFGYAQDYSLYDPRGRCGDDGGHEDYFKAMTWLSARGFFPRPGTSPGGITAGRDMTRQALLLVGALHEAEREGKPAYVLWDRIYHPTSFLGGREADLDASAYTRIAREVLGDGFSLDRLNDDALMDDFVARALAERKPRISSLVGEGDPGDESSVSFRLFPQARYPDDYVFEQMVAPLVNERYMPRGLDVPAALGSDRALQVLDQYYAENAFEGYGEQVAALRKLFNSVDPRQLHSNSYWARMDVLRLLLKPYGEGYPGFMKSPAWQDRCTYSFLGSWAEMRREDIAVTGMTDGAERTGEQVAGAQGYVEPCPEAFARMAAATDMIRRGLEERDLASEPVRQRLDEFHLLLLDLMNMAERELRGESLSAEEYETLAGFGETMRRLVSPPVEANGEPPAELLASAVRLYSGGEYGETLQAAVGKPTVYYVIAPVAGRPTLTVGAGYSYYEFVRPADSPLSSEAWREIVESGNLPEKPAWTSSFMQ